MIKVGRCIRLYKTNGGRKSAVTQMVGNHLSNIGHPGPANYFVGFRDVTKGHHFGLSFGYAWWVEKIRGRNGVYCKDV